MEDNPFVFILGILVMASVMFLALVGAVNIFTHSDCIEACRRDENIQYHAKEIERLRGDK